MSTVSMAGTEIAAGDLAAHPERYTKCFQAARAEVGHAWCLCSPQDPQPLVIRQRKGRYHLASWPSRGHQHAAWCRWYRPDPELSGRSTYTGAVTTDESETSLKFSEALLSKTSSPKSSRTTSVTGHVSAQASPSKFGLLGLLHYLWEQAGLSQWDPSEPSRTWRECRTRLLEHGEGCWINGMDLSEAVYIVPPFERSRAEENAAGWKSFLARLGRGRKEHRRGLVLGELRREDGLTPTAKGGVRVKLANLRAPLFTSQRLEARVRQSHPSVFSAATEQVSAHRVVALCLVDHSNGVALVDDMALMLTTDTGIPADSSFELRMAHALTAARRRLLKPLRYDHRDAVFPDFVLLDDTPPTYVEVWGVQGRQSYETRKRDKQDYYRQTGRALLEWDVRHPLPEIPRAQVLA